MDKLSFIPPIPSARSIAAGSELNVLGGVVNPLGEELPLRITLWGRADHGWRELTAIDTVLQGHEHRHLYYTIPARCTLPEFWNGEVPEELELITRESLPRENERGVLIFITG